MPRVSREETARREQFMRDLFQATPDLSMPKANQQFQKRFGSQMRPQRVYAIRKEAWKTIGFKGLDQGGRGRPATPIIADRTPSHAGGDKGNARLLPVEKGHEKAVADALKALKRDGSFSGDVDYAGSGYVVVVV